MEMFYSDQKIVNDPFDQKKQLKIRFCFIEFSHFEVKTSFFFFVKKAIYFEKPKLRGIHFGKILEQGGISAIIMLFDSTNLSTVSVNKFFFFLICQKTLFHFNF
jgi:hypothetical protein